MAIHTAIETEVQFNTKPKIKIVKIKKDTVTLQIMMVDHETQKVIQDLGKLVLKSGDSVTIEGIFFPISFFMK